MARPKKKIVVVDLDWIGDFGRALVRLVDAQTAFANAQLLRLKSQEDSYKNAAEQITSAFVQRAQQTASSLKLPDDQESTEVDLASFLSDSNKQ